MEDAGFLAGLVAVFIGLALVSLPLALVVGGGALALGSWAARAHSRAIANAREGSSPGGDSS